MNAPDFEEIEHTADLALRVRGQDLTQLFVYAAQGMFYLLRCREADRPAERQRVDVELDAPDVETLLVDWLGELLYLADHRQLCLDVFAISELSEVRLRATVVGDSARSPERDIKAVTFSDLRVLRHDDGSLETTVTFDV